LRLSPPGTLTRAGVGPDAADAEVGSSAETAAAFMVGSAVPPPVAPRPAPSIGGHFLPSSGESAGRIMIARGSTWGSVRSSCAV
jgi:hypothetical protein